MPVHNIVAITDWKPFTPKHPLTWRAIMKDGTVITEGSIRSFLHVDQSQLERLEIVNAAGSVVYATSKKPILRKHRSKPGANGPEYLMDMVESGEGNDWEIAFIFHDPEHVETQKEHGGARFRWPISTDGHAAFLAAHPNPR